MLSSLKKKILKSIKSKKLNVFGFFLLLSFMFLMVAKLSKTYTETIPFHITYINVPEQHNIASTHDSIIMVRVSAYGFHLVSHNFYRHYLTIDFKKEVQKRDSSYYWLSKTGISRIDTQLGKSIQVLSVQPDSLVFPYDVMAVKTVPVHLNAEITYASGYDSLDSLKLQPDSVKVIGPKNMVEKITKINTKYIKLSEVNHSINKKVSLVINDNLENIKLSNNTIQIFAEVEKFTEGTFEVPVNIINLPTNININYFPKTIEVSYYVSLEDYNKVEALNFKVVCDYNDVKNLDKSYFSPELVSIPNEVKSAKLKKNRVEFIIIK